ncbi:MAG: sterol desaturase family protein [Spirochaetes bacterium]|nr:sterol desaturase family protein [Spirochaetota bacterium]
MANDSSQRLFVSSKDETPRMFKSDFVEFFSRVHPATPHAIYWPVIGFFLYKAFSMDPAWTLPALLIPSGFLFWTLAEYLLHRFFFHLHLENRLWKKIHFYIHGVHHDYPSDSKRLVMPPAASIPLALLFYFLFWAVFQVASPNPYPGVWFVFSGFVMGYLAYDTLHWATHHLPFENKIFLALKQFHLKHHFKTPDLRYGISSPFWDVVFGTLKEK